MRAENFTPILIVCEDCAGYQGTIIVFYLMDMVVYSKKIGVPGGFLSWGTMG